MFNWTKIKKSPGSAHLKNWNVAIGQSLWQSRHLYLHQAIVHFYKKLTALLKRRKWSKRGRVLTQLVDARLFCKTKAWIAIEFQRKNQGFLKAQDSKSLKEPRPNITLSFLNQGSGCVAQLVEQSLPILEVHDLNPVIGKNLFILNICLLSPVYWKDENKEKEAGNGPF